MQNLQPLADFLATFPKPIVILDLETTGGDLLRERITEIAFLHIHAGKITPVSQLIQPQQSISPFIENLTGISDAMVADAPLFGEFLPQILPMLRGSLLIAHNSRFDYSFLRHEAQRASVDLGMQTLCSVQLSRRLYPEFHKHNLDAIIERHGLHTENRHRAMSDVLNLAHFLQAALLERGATAWQQHAQALIQPATLPERLSENLRAALEALPDAAGVSVWYNAQDEIQAVYTHERAYHEMPALLRRVPPLSAHSARVAFFATVGSLHSQLVQAQIMRAHQLQPSENSTRHSIRFDLDAHDGCLKARIRPLKSGFHAQPPHGLFQHPKAAKRALAAWSKDNGICPTQLGILPDMLPKGEPCPAQIISGCVSACAMQNTVLHNENVLNAQHLLPVCDWGRDARVMIRETEPISGKTMAFICDSGALQVGDEWFVNNDLLAVLKHKFKHCKDDIQAA
ncbi:exonuclease domain-containing protein [Neisseriaceae bacterium B1]